MSYVIYYDRSSKTWYGYWIDKTGNQLHESINAHTRDQVLIDLGMEKANLFS